ncbi:MAG: 2-hydroxyacyl-CoA dehydratase [Deltaproteobacteria bacterium]|nr:2-hydroxyacyl-CoA dehydratase [Deltaproteobacteria bacterium]
MSVISEIKNISQMTLNNHLKQKISNNEKIIGYICSYVPEELIHAAGGVPYRLRAVESKGTSMGDTYFSSNNCSFARRIMDKALSGDFDFLNGVVFMNGCDHNRRIYDNWRYSETGKGFNYMLFVPHAKSPASFDQYFHELHKLKSFLEEKMETEITPEKLSESTILYNRKRQLLKKISETRVEKTVPLSGTEFLSIMLAVNVLPVETAIDFLEKIIEEIQNGRVFSKNPALRIFITGSCVEEISHLELLESSDAVVVADSICFGSRYFENNVEITDDIFQSIAQRYLYNISCPRMMDDYRGRINYYRDMISRYSADAVIIEKLEFCSMMSGESYICSQEMDRYNIPSITLTRELYGGGTGQLKTRIQAFYEKVVNLT